MRHLSLIFVGLIAVFVLGCKSGTDQTDVAKTDDSKAVAVPPKAGGAAGGARAQAGSAMLGPGAKDADARLGSKLR